MYVRTVEEWMKILDGMFPHEAAKRILGDITDYKDNGNHKLADREQLGHALQAFASLQQRG